VSAVTGRVFTIGHSTRSWEDFLSLLREARVSTVVDVRRFPASRRYPHFGGPALARALAEAGIGYVHELDLGGRRGPREGSPNVAWHVAAFRGYADHMSSDAFQAALARLRTLAAGERPAILCAEAVPWRCHRQLIADALVAAGTPVTHVLGRGQLRPHELNPAAQVDARGGLTYPAAVKAPRLF